MNLQVDVVENLKTGTLEVFIDKTNFGVFDDIDKGIYSYFPRRNEKLTGDHYIAIGHALNALNK